MEVSKGLFVPDCRLCLQDLGQARRKMQLMEAPCQELIQLERKLEVALSFDQVSEGKVTAVMPHQEMLLRKDLEAQL